MLHRQVIQRPASSTRRTFGGRQPLRLGRGPVPAHPWTTGHGLGEVARASGEAASIAESDAAVLPAAPTPLPSPDVPDAGAPLPPDAAASTHTHTSPDEPSTSGSERSWPGSRGDRGRGRSFGRGPGRGRGRGSGRSGPHFQREPPPYISAITSLYAWPRPLPLSSRPDFLACYPVPPGKAFNVNSFLGRVDPCGGKYLVTQESYAAFLESYLAALQGGYQLYLTENYHHQVYKYFVELDWDWDTDLSLVMEVTPRLIRLISDVAGDFYALPYPTPITSVRSPFKVHLNFPQLLTTELLACVCRDRILEACREQLPGYDVDWERLIDFPHGSLRLMGSRKGPHMDSDPAWVQDKAYYPARLVEGRWRPGELSAKLLRAASIFPAPDKVAAFERSPRYLDMVFSDMEAYKQKLEERRRRRADQRGGQAGGSGAAADSGPKPKQLNLAPGSGRLPLHVTLAVRPDETVSVQIYVKSRYRTRGQQVFRAGEASRKAGTEAAAKLAAAGAGGATAATVAAAWTAVTAALAATAVTAETVTTAEAEAVAVAASGTADETAAMAAATAETAASGLEVAG